MSLEIKQLWTFFDRAALNAEPISGWKDVLCVYLLLCKTVLEERNQSAEFVAMFQLCLKGSLDSYPGFGGLITAE